MNEEKPKEKIDITRLNRKERRNIGKQVGGKIFGRNLPYRKIVPDPARPGKGRYMPIAEFFAAREKEIAAEKKAFVEQAKTKDVQSPHG